MLTDTQQNMKKDSKSIGSFPNFAAEPHHGSSGCSHFRCLGPLSFHTAALGAHLSLSMNDRRAERNRKTFQGGLAFSSRPVCVQEKIHLRVESCDQHWKGALRLGFTSTPPPSVPKFPHTLDISDLSINPGFWARALPDSHTQPGAELCFWVTPRGEVVYQGPDGLKEKILQGLDVKQPLWAIIDLYGQTRAVLLLGSVMKHSLLLKRRSCPVPCPPAVSPGDSCLCVDSGCPCRTPQDFKIPLTQRASSAPGSVEDCVVCQSASVCVTLPCGHRCLCSPCFHRVNSEFGSCPLCRQAITYSPPTAIPISGSDDRDTSWTVVDSW